MMPTIYREITPVYSYFVSAVAVVVACGGRCGRGRWAAGRGEAGQSREDFLMMVLFYGALKVHPPGEDNVLLLLWWRWWWWWPWRVWDGRVSDGVVLAVVVTVSSRRGGGECLYACVLFVTSVWEGDREWFGVGTQGVASWWEKEWLGVAIWWVLNDMCHVNIKGWVCGHNWYR